MDLTAAAERSTYTEILNTSRRIIEENNNLKEGGEEEETTVSLRQKKVLGVRVIEGEGQERGETQTHSKAMKTKKKRQF